MSEEDAKIIIPLAIILNIITEICLIMRLVLQFICPVFRTKAMKLQFNVCLTQFITMTMYVLGVNFPLSSWICVIFSVFDHYIILSQFVWLIILANDIRQRMLNSKNINPIDGTSWMDIRSQLIFGWGTSLIFPLIGILLQYSGEIQDKYKPRYGEKSCCFQPENIEQLIFYVPLFLAIIINIALFVLICIGLRKAFKTRDELISGHRPYIWTYMKLSLLMGMNYVLVFLLPFVNNFIFWLSILIVHALHGIYAGAAFVFTKEVYKSIFGTKSEDTPKRSLEEAIVSRRNST